jgi:MFS family permease
MKRNFNGELIAVITVLGLGSLAMAIPAPILPLYLTSIGITPAVLGLIQSVIMVGMVIGEPSMGWLADRVGMKIPLSIGTFFCGLAILSFVFSRDIVAIFFISVFWGFTRSAIFGPGRGYIGMSAPPLKRATFMAFISVIMAASRTLGALPGGFVADTLGYHWVFIIAAAISGIGGLVVVVFLKKPKQARLKPAEAVPPAAETRPPGGEPRVLRLLFAQGSVALFFFLGLGIMFTFLPLLATEVVGVSATQVGIIFTISGLVSMSLSVPMAMVADRKGKKLLMMGGMLMSSVAMAGLAYAQSFLWLIGFIAVFGAGMAMFEPASLGLISSLVPARRLSTAMGIYGGAFENSGIIAGSALAGFVWSTWGPEATFLIGTVTGGLGMLVCLLFVKEHKTPSA